MATINVTQNRGGEFKVYLTRAGGPATPPELNLDYTVQGIEPDMLLEELAAELEHLARKLKGGADYVKLHSQLMDSSGPIPLR